MPVVDETIASLARKSFIEDPIAGTKYSRATSIVSSAYKRHGRILETAIRESLRDSNRHRVWQDDDFRISAAADALVASFIGKPNEEFLSSVLLALWRASASPANRYDRIRRGRSVHSGLRGEARQRSIRRRENSVYHARLQVCSGLFKSYGETSHVTPTAAEARSSFTTACGQFRAGGRWCTTRWTHILGFQSWKWSSRPMTISGNGSISCSKRRKYGAIHADPPWSFRNWSAKGTGRNAVSHYDCLGLDALASASRCGDFAADDCALFVWAIDPLLATPLS